jgi:DNA-directed RNA polymerase specialized sigma subunit
MSFSNDREGNQFKVTVLRSIDPEKEVLTLKGKLPEPDDPEKLVINQLQRDPETSYMQLAQQLGVSTSTVKRLLQEMKQGGRLHGAAGQEVVPGRFCGRHHPNDPFHTLP